MGKIPIGLQLYSVRQDCEKDLARVLGELAGMGYQGVEFAGYYGRSAQDLRKMLDENGLKCCGTHTALDTVTGDALKRTAEFNQVLGNPFLIVPWLGKERMGSLAVLQETVKLFNELAEKAKGLGARVGYHAHGDDFALTPEGISPWEYLFGHTKPEVVMQMDVGNCLAGGGDPYAMLKKFPGRSATVHLKEHGGPAGAVVGEGVVKWDEVFAICQSIGGTQWYIVEQESYGGTPMESVKKCVEKLRKMGR